MDLDYHRLREEQLMRESGHPCVCGRRSWSREPVRDPTRRRFKCAVCLSVLDVSAELFRDPVTQAGEDQPPVAKPDQTEHQEGSEPGEARLGSCDGPF
jgi:hypothetical protein